MSRAQEIGADRRRESLTLALKSPLDTQRTVPVWLQRTSVPDPHCRIGSASDAILQFTIAAPEPGSAWRPRTAALCGHSMARFLLYKRCVVKTDHAGFEGGRQAREVGGGSVPHVLAQISQAVSPSSDQRLVPGAAGQAAPTGCRRRAAPRSALPSRRLHRLHPHRVGGSPGVARPGLAPETIVARLIPALAVPKSALGSWAAGLLVEAVAQRNSCATLRP